MELQRADAERQIERHLGAEDVPAEPAEAAFVVALVEARALLEQLVDRIERQQHRQQQRRRATAATTAITMMRERCACDGLVRTISASMKAEVRTNWPQAAREKASRIASAMMPSAMALRNDFAEAVGDDALQHEQRRQDQERAEHVRVLEGAARAVIQRQQVVSAGHQIEIAGDAGERRDQRADDQAAAQHVEPGRGIFRQHHGEEDHGDRHVPGCRDPVARPRACPSAEWRRSYSRY